MGLDPISIALMAGAGAGLYSMSQKKAPKSPTPGAPPIPVTPGEEITKARKKYRPAAQVFKDEDLRLGSAGKLGL
jgi:hypothetical protein